MNNLRSLWWRFLVWAITRGQPPGTTVVFHNMAYVTEEAKAKIREEIWGRGGNKSPLPR